MRTYFPPFPIVTPAARSAALRADLSPERIRHRFSIHQSFSAPKLPIENSSSNFLTIGEFLSLESNKQEVQSPTQQSMSTVRATGAAARAAWPRSSSFASNVPTYVASVEGRGNRRQWLCSRFITSRKHRYRSNKNLIHSFEFNVRRSRKAVNEQRGEK